MSAADRAALVLGPTGLVGGHCLELLLGDARYARVTVLGRRPLERRHPRLQERVADFEHLGPHAEAFAAHSVFCCLGTTLRAAGSRQAFRRVDFDFVVAAARLAAERGARQFLLVSALGASARSRVFYNRVKGEAEEAVRALPIAGVAIFRPSLLLGARGERRAAEALAQKVVPLLHPVLVGPLRKYRAVPAAWVARAMVRLAGEGIRGVRVVESDEIASLAEEAA